MPPTNPDHFDHDDHRDRLARAGDLLESLGKDDLAGACRRARSLHTNMIGRVSHARQALAKLERIDGKCYLDPVALARATHERYRLTVQARDILVRYVAQPEAPWLVPAHVLFPREEEG
jgi:hypothetical protein